MKFNVCIGMVTFLVIIIAATSVYAQATQPLWRVILDGWCTSHGYVGIEVDGNNNNVFGLGCKDSSGTRYGLDLIAICTELYGADYANPQYSDFSNPDSWSCYRMEVQPPPAVNQPQENSGDTQPVQQSGGNNSSDGQQSSGDSGYTAPVSEPVQPQETSSESSDCIARSGLSVGDTAEVVPGEPNNRLRSGPSTEFSVIGSIPPGDPFVIVGGPSCGSGYVWWQVDYYGTVGWTVEGDSSHLWIAWATEELESSSSGSTKQTTDCSSAPSQRLVVGEIARVSTDELKIRATPSIHAEVLANMPTNAIVVITGYPVCSDGYWWYPVSGGYGDGWSAEGDNSEYYLETVQYSGYVYTGPFTAIGAWYKAWMASEHIACAVFAVPNDVYQRRPNYAIWFEASDGTQISAGYYAEGSGLEGQFNVVTPANSMLYGVCISGSYFLQHPLDGLWYASEFSDPNHWLLTAY